MLVVLSEINCLHNLNTYGVYPDEFYTDFEAFKNRVVSIEDAQVLIITAGVCRFYKKLLIELCKTLHKRLNDDCDSGIKEFFVLSDTNLPQLEEYYKFYNGDLSDCEEFDKWESLGKVDIISHLRGSEKKCSLYLSDFDKVDIEDAVENYKHRHNSEDDYVPLIKVLDVKKMIAEAEK